MDSDNNDTGKKTKCFTISTKKLRMEMVNSQTEGLNSISDISRVNNNQNKSNTLKTNITQNKERTN